MPLWLFRDMVQNQAIATATQAAPAGAWSLQRVRVDLLVAVTLAALAGVACFWGAAQLPASLLARPIDVWFDSDAPGVYDSMVSIANDPQRTEVHPIFWLLTFPPCLLLQKLGLGPLPAARGVMALCAFLWTGLLFALFRLLGLRRPDAALFSVLAAVSAGAMFWFTVPETYPWASLGIVLALAMTAWAHHDPRARSEAWFAALSAATLAITITNWMIGILAALTHFRFWRAVQISVNALVAVVLLWTVQKFLLPASKFFLQVGGEGTYLFHPDRIGPLNILGSFFFHTVVMPATRPLPIQMPYTAGGPPAPALALITQPSLPGSGGLWGAVACLLWVGLLALGVWALFTLTEYPRLRLTVGLALLGQLGLHLLYGKETFLYAPHVLPLLIAVAALGARTRARPAVLALATGRIMFAGINNVQQFGRVADFVRYRSRIADPAPAAAAAQARVSIAPAASQR